MEQSKDLERVKINNPKNQMRLVQKKSPHFWGLFLKIILFKTAKQRRLLLRNCTMLFVVRFGLRPKDWECREF
jgi:hypothetical protein